MTISTADVSTENATSYLRQLCRHWAHKFPVEFDDHQGRIELPAAVCTLKAEPALLRVQVALTADGDADRMEKVVAEHLQRFGFREPLVFNWQRRTEA
jgi:hypothetical protein